MQLVELSNIIQNIHIAFSRQAGRSVDISLTLRNWLIGFYIKEYEQKGQHRVDYGTNIINKLAENLQKAKIPATSFTSLRQYRLFYENYPLICQIIPTQLDMLVKQQYLPIEICQAVSGKFQSDKIKVHDVPSLPIENLINNLSYSHFTELIKINDPLKRSFYEIETIRSNWGSRELRRQISTLYYERLGLSKNKENIAKMVATGTYAHDIKDVIRDPYMFEFVGIKQDDITEADLSNALLKQLNSYVKYYKKHEMYSGDNPPVGLLLCIEKNEALAEYALGGMDNQLFISKYKLELPSQSDIKNFIENALKKLVD